MPNDFFWGPQHGGPPSMGPVTPLAGRLHLTLPGGPHLTENLTGDGKLHYSLSPEGEITALTLKPIGGKLR